MHYLHKILVHIPECGEADSKEELIENIRYRAESETEDYYNQVFDWRETESAGGWSDEYPNQVYFAEDDVEWFIKEINQAIESQKRELDYHKKELGDFNLSEIIDKSLKAHEEYDKNPDVVNEYALEDSSTNCGLSQIISCAIYENEQIEFTACTDFSDEEYVLYEQAYPWHMSKLDFTMTEDKVKGILQKYIKVLTDKEIEICSRDPENGG